MVDDTFTGTAITGDNIDDARRQSGLVTQFGEAKRRQRRVFSRFQHHGISGGQCRRNLPGKHQQREVPRHDLADDAKGYLVGELAIHQLRPSGVMVEMTRHQRHIDIAAFADRLAVIQCFENRQMPGMLLHQPGQGIQVTGASMTAKGHPLFLRRPGRLDRRIHIGGTTLGNIGKDLASGRIAGLEGL